MRWPCLALAREAPDPSPYTHRGALSADAARHSPALLAGGTFRKIPKHGPVSRGPTEPPSPSHVVSSRDILLRATAAAVVFRRVCVAPV